MDYERSMEQFRSQLADVWNKRKLDQLRSQIDDVRHNVDELVRSYNRVMGTATDMLGETQRRMAKQARESLEGAAEGVSEGGFSFWIPVAVLGAIGAGVWLYNTFMTGAPEAQRQPFTNQPAGSPPPMTSTQTPFSEPR
jgi:hypothetical protein